MSTAASLRALLAWAVPCANGGVPVMTLESAVNVPSNASTCSEIFTPGVSPVNWNEVVNASVEPSSVYCEPFTE